MAHYTWNESTPQGAKLRSLLTALNTLLHGAADLQGMLNQMSSAQVNALFGFSDGVASPDAITAGNAKGELLSDFGKLLSDASQTNTFAALRQMLDQFA